jgi:hypothetical protein
VRRHAVENPNLDMNVFIENTNKALPDALARYPWEHVAWSLDGTTILAHAPDLGDLYREVDRLGITDFVSDFLAPEDGDPSAGVPQAVAAANDPGDGP